MQLYKKIKSIIIFFALLILISGCQNPSQELSEGPANEENGIEIGICFDSFVIERWEKDRDVFVSVAKDLGAEVNVQNANGDVEEQIKQIDYFINKDVDAIVIISVDGEALEDIVKKARNKGIKVIAYDRLIPNSNVDLYVSFDNEMVGSMMAEALISAGLPNNKVVMFQGPTTDNNVQMIEAGFTKIMNENNIEIVDSMNCEGWKAELAADYIYNHPEMFEGVDGIMCGNDNVATAVVHVLSEKRMAGSMALVGQDADIEACQRIVEGTQTMTIYKPVEKEAQSAAEATVALIKGESLEETSTFNDGTNEVTSIVLEPILVDKSNIDSVIIGSGFHLKEDVYLYSK